MAVDAIARGLGARALGQLGQVVAPASNTVAADALAEWLGNSILTMVSKPNLYVGPPMTWLGAGTFTQLSDVSAEMVSDGTGNSGFYKKIRVIPGCLYELQYVVSTSAAQTIVRGGNTTTGLELFNRIINAGTNTTLTETFTPQQPDIFISAGYGPAGADITVSAVVMRQRSVRPAFYAWGDSLTQGSGASPASNAYPAVLATLYSTTRILLNKGVGGETSTQILSRITGQANGITFGNVHILWMGRNDTHDAGGATTTLANIATAVGQLGAHCFICSITTSAGDSEAQKDNIYSTNATLQSTYGERYINLLETLQAANDGSVQDLDDVANRLIPSSLRSDATHLNNAGYGVVAGKVYAALART